MSKPSKNKPHAKCGAKTRSGDTCQGKAMDNGRCRMHGGKVGENHGAPVGNQNARSHGLYSSALTTDIGLHTYEAAKSKPNQELARDSAEFLVAKIVEAYQGDPETHPNLLVVSAALAKLKPLLDVREEQDQDAAGDLAEALAEAEAQEDAGRESGSVEG